MSYKAFVSSTFKDLKDHRAHVIRALRKAGFFVDPMEDWTSSADEPKEFSRQRLEGCHLCVLLVARRRGHVPSGERLSITQMEYDEAKRQGIDVLPYLMDDSVSEDDWPWEEKDEVGRWRDELLEHQGVETFKKTPTTIDIAPALTRWIAEQGPKVAERLYLQNVRREHGRIKFVSLPKLEDNPDAAIDRLYVVPAMSDRWISPDSDPSEWPETKPVIEMPERLVLLGDPGSGKSTLVSWLSWQFASGNWRAGDVSPLILARRGSPDPAETADRRSPESLEKGDLRSAEVARSGVRPQRAGDRPQRESAAHQDNLIPLPMILRDLGISAGITWEGLLETFIAQPSYSVLTMDNLKRILKEGRAMIMLDGLDEIGDPQVRRDLRDAVWFGMGENKICRWLMTSRIVGYDEVPFDKTWRSAKRGSDFNTEPKCAIRKPTDIFMELAKQRYVAPFDDDQVDQFAQNWFVIREPTEHAARVGAKELIEAIRADQGTKSLGRIPNLLTMMALIWRIEAHLPNGRALLCHKIAEAYLYTIDRWRRIDPRAERLEDRRRWLARVGFEMQRLRGVADDLAKNKSKEILATGEQVRGWIAAAMCETGREADEKEAAEFVDYLGRRTGLLLPRGEDRFAFLHLSFQEYFAAWYLKENIATPEWVEDEADDLAVGTGKQDLQRYAATAVWRETLVFLIELLAVEQPKWLNRVRKCLFGQDYLVISSGEETQAKQAELLARLATDPQAGFADDERWRAIKACCRWEVREQKRLQHKRFSDDMDVLRSLLAVDSKTERQRVLSALVVCAEQIDLRNLQLRGTQVSDLMPLSRLENLEELDLSLTLVSDLSALSGLPNLQVLRLVGTPVSDLTPISRLSSLQELHLHGTRVSDLTPLSGLVGLRTLDVNSTPVSNLLPLAGLARLQVLDLAYTEVSDVTPLARLTGLLELGLGWTQVSDVTPISGLNQVWVYFFESEVVKAPKEFERQVKRYSD